MGFKYTPPPTQVTPGQLLWEYLPSDIPPGYTTNDIWNKNNATGGVLALYGGAGSEFSLMGVSPTIAQMVRGWAAEYVEIELAQFLSRFRKYNAANERGSLNLSDNTSETGGMVAEVESIDADGNYAKAAASSQDGYLVSDQSAGGGGVIKIIAQGGAAAIVQDDGVDVFAIANGGEIRTDQSSAVIPLTTDSLLPIYHLDGTLRGYIEVKIAL